MLARINRVKVPSDKLDAVIEAYKSSMYPYITSQEGNRGAMVFVDRVNNEVIGIGVWDSEDSLKKMLVNRPTTVEAAVGGKLSSTVYEVVVKS
jgi:heme-degrading monooxygenase HmoA